MAALVKCPACEKRFDRDKEPFKKDGRRYVHEKCYDEYMENKNKPKKTEKKEKTLDEMTPKEVEEFHRRELIDYVMYLQNTNRPHGLIFKQMKDLREKGYSYQGMKSTLYYFHEIKGNPVLGDGIGIVPFVYEDAIQWFTTKVNSEKHYRKLKEDGNPISKTKKVVVNKEEKQGTKSLKVLDIEDL